MNKNILGTEAHGEREPVDSLAPVVRGSAFIAEHQRPFPSAGAATSPEALAALRRAADRVVILELPAHVGVDPELCAAVQPYPPIPSENTTFRITGRGNDPHIR